jgi:hypothetical protein
MQVRRFIDDTIADVRQTGDVLCSDANGPPEINGRNPSARLCGTYGGKCAATGTTADLISWRGASTALSAAVSGRHAPSGARP